jgi:hypothetical protein
MSADPRVEALIAWAWQRTDKLAGPPAATLVDTPSSPAAAAELASAAAGAYACRAVRAGNRIVALLGELGEPGARELVRLRDSVRYRDARNTIEKTLRRLSHELRIPAGELEDRFEGIALYRSLSTRVAVGRYVAVIRVSDDLRQVNTAWHDRTGRLLTRRPSAVAGRTDELAEVDDVRTRLRAHVAAVRERLEQTMVQGRSWTAEEWAASMFADPLRAAMAKRMIWRIDSTAPVLAIVTDAGLRDLDDLPVSLDPRDSIAVWHPADDPAAQQAGANAWTRWGSISRSPRPTETSCSPRLTRHGSRSLLGGAYCSDPFEDSYAAGAGKSRTWDGGSSSHKRHSKSPVTVRLPSLRSTSIMASKTTTTFSSSERSAFVPSSMPTSTPESFPAASSPKQRGISSALSP